MLAIIKWTIAREELAVAYGTLFDIAVRHVKLALENSAIVARILSGLPIIVLVPVTDASNIFAIQHI